MINKLESKLDEYGLTKLCEKKSKIFKKVYNKCLALNNEKVLIIGDYGSENRTAAGVMAYTNYLYCQDNGIRHELILQDLKHRLMSADPHVINALSTHENKNVIIANISERLGKLGDIGKSFRKFCRSREHKYLSCTSLGSLENHNLKNFIKAVDINYNSMAKKHAKLKEKLDSGNSLRITTKAGTDVLFDISYRDGISADGIYTKPGQGGNLPAGEVYIAPKEDKTEGRIFIDGSVKTTKETILSKEPTELILKEGKITTIKGGHEADELRKSLAWAHKHAKVKDGLRRIGEVGIGLNKKAKPIGCTLLDEKAYKTAHVAIGNNYWFGGNIKAIIHLDQVFRNPKIYIDDKRIRY